MAPLVKLKDIIEGMEGQSDKGSSHLNTKTGEVIYIPDEEEERSGGEIIVMLYRRRIG